MTKNIRPIVLSASAMAAAISTLAQTVHEHPTIRIAISDPVATMDGEARALSEMHQESIRSAMVGAATEAELRRNMGIVLPAVDIDPTTMHDSWVRLSNANYTGVIRPGTPSLDGIGRLLGPNSDSTLDDSIDQIQTRPGVQACYVNCHSACHGSRGWR